MAKYEIKVEFDEQAMDYVIASLKTVQERHPGNNTEFNRVLGKGLETLEKSMRVVRR